MPVISAGPQINCCPGGFSPCFNDNNPPPISSCSTNSTQQSSPTFQKYYVDLLDFSPIQISVMPIVETFLLASIILAAFSISSVLGGHLFTSSVTFYMSPFSIVIISVVAIPLWMNYQLSGNNGSFQLLLLSGCFQGILVGAAISHLSLFSEPLVIPALLVNTVILFSLGDMNRPFVLSIVTSASLLFHYILGSSFTLHYYFLSLLYTLAFIVPIQISVRDQNAIENTDQYATILVALIIGARCLVYGIFGESDS